MAKQIKRVDLLKGDHVEILVSIQEVLKGGTIESRLTKDTVQMPAHKDLTDAFLRLVPHLMFSCRFAKPEVFSRDWFDEWDFLDDPRFEGISVTGAMVVGKEVMDGVKLIGRNTHPNGDVVAFTSPVIWLDAVADNKYPLLSYLEDHITILFAEADQYYFRKKYAVEEPDIVSVK